MEHAAHNPAQRRTLHPDEIVATRRTIRRYESISHLGELANPLFRQRSSLLRGDTETLLRGELLSAYYNRTDYYAEITDMEAVIRLSQLPQFIAVACVHYGVRD